MTSIFEKYRKPTQYEGVYRYEAPEGKHWESLDTNYGKIIYDGIDLLNPYVLVDDNNEKEMK